MKSNAREMRDLSKEELTTKAAELKKELFNLRFQQAMGQIEKQFGKGAIMRMGVSGALLPIATIPTGAPPLMNSVSSFMLSPDLYLVVEASLKVHTGVPFGVYLSSGSLVRLPMSMTLLNI